MVSQAREREPSAGQHDRANALSSELVDDSNCVERKFTDSVPSLELWSSTSPTLSE